MLTGCQPREDITEAGKKWSANETQSVPLRIRKNQFNKENLIVNPSFEEGKYFLKDSDDRSANIIEQLEAKGVLSPPNAKGNREIV